MPPALGLPLALDAPLGTPREHRIGEHVVEDLVALAALAGSSTERRIRSPPSVASTRHELVGARRPRSRRGRSSAARSSSPDGVTRWSKTAARRPCRPASSAGARARGGRARSPGRRRGSRTSRAAARPSRASRSVSQSRSITSWRIGASTCPSVAAAERHAAELDAARRRPVEHRVDELVDLARLAASSLQRASGPAIAAAARRRGRGAEPQVVARARSGCAP